MYTNTRLSLRHSVLLGLLCIGCALDAQADQRAELLTLRNTLIGMIEELVAKGVITEAQAVELIDRAEREAQEETARIVAEAEGEDPGASVRVTYVPDVVRDALREEIRADLRDVVVEDVVQQARDQAWGVPAGLPAWIYDIRWNADIRLRSQLDRFDSGNFPAFNFQAINRAGTVTAAGQNALLNVSEDRETLRGRARLGLNVRLSDRWHGGLRIATGTEGNPVTRNVVFAQADPDITTGVDLAFAHYRSDHFLFTAGRMPNPFVHTALVWDSDLTFEGLSMTGVLPFTAFGGQANAFLTAGAFPLEEFEFASDDKWLFGAQLGTQFLSRGGMRWGAAVAFYEFDNVAGRRNEPASILFDYTAPAFMQKGNTLFDIRNDTDPDTRRFALAADYRLLNGTLYLTSAPLPLPWSIGGRPLEVSAVADYVRNIGWDDDAILRRTGVTGIDARTGGYQFRLAIGHPAVEQRGDFSLATFLRHLERDAVLDGFADSDFHLGGTDAEGWGLELRYGLARRVWLGATYLSANEIDGPPLAIDVLQFDLNVRF